MVTMRELALYALMYDTVVARAMRRALGIAGGPPRRRATPRVERPSRDSERDIMWCFENHEPAKEDRLAAVGFPGVY